MKVPHNRFPTPSMNEQTTTHVHDFQFVLYLKGTWALYRCECGMEMQQDATETMRDVADVITG